MRVRFELRNIAEPFTFVVENTTYALSATQHLAEKRNLAANIYEYVLKTPHGKNVWLTLVGDEDATSGLGVERGWYVTQVLSEEEAKFLIKALSEFTKLYEP